VYTNIIARDKRRLIIIRGVSLDLKYSEIASQIGASQGILRSDIKYMRRNDDLGFKQAEKDQLLVRELNAKDSIHVQQNERFLDMTGISLQEKSFRNMIDFNKNALMKILQSEDQNAGITKLSSSIQKSLKKHGIVTKRMQDKEITNRAKEYLNNN
jgi:hypothetical protein